MDSLKIDEIILIIKSNIENHFNYIIIPLVLFVISLIIFFKTTSSKKKSQTKTASDNITTKDTNNNNKKNKKKTISPTLQPNIGITKKHIDTPVPSPPIQPVTTTTTSTSEPIQPVQQHKLFFKTCKAGDIIDCIKFSEDGKYLSICGADRSIKMNIFETLIGNSKLVPVQQFGLQLPFDNATCISWGNKTIYATLNESQKLVSYNILDQKNAQGKSYEAGFSVSLDSKSNIKSICSSSQSPYILTCSGDDTIIKIFNLKGNLVQTINNGQIKNYMAAMSPCGRFFGIASFTSEVKIYECLKKKDGSIDQCKRVMSLTGYKACIYAIGFSSDGLKIITSSKDGSIRLWNLNVNYSLEVDPECIYSIPSEIGVIDMISISPDSNVIAGVNTTKNVIGFFNLSNGNLIDSINLGNAGTPKVINSIAWSPDSKYLVSGGNDRLLYIWSNPKKL